MYIILLSVHMHINNLYICYTLLSPRFLYFLIHFAWALVGVGKSVGNNILLFSINSSFFLNFDFVTCVNLAPLNLVYRFFVSSSG